LPEGKKKRDIFFTPGAEKKKGERKMVRRPTAKKGRKTAAPLDLRVDTVDRGGKEGVARTG